MSTDDGRLVSNFAVAALRGEPLQVYGDGQATRSLMVRPELPLVSLPLFLGDAVTNPP